MSNRNSTHLVVSDNGAGIAKADRERIFEPFFTTKGEEAMGMGLAISRSIMEAHGGRLRIESEPARGTSVSLYLPKMSGRSH